MLAPSHFHLSGLGKDKNEDKFQHKILKSPHPLTWDLKGLKILLYLYMYAKAGFKALSFFKALQILNREDNYDDIFS